MIRLIKIATNNKSENERALDLVKSKHVVKGSNNKPEDIKNNFFTLFANQDKYISGQMAAAVYTVKANNYSILSNSRRTEFKFDQLITSSGHDNSVFDRYTDIEVARFLHQNMKLIFSDLIEKCHDRVPSELPVFPLQFYAK